MTTIIQKSGQSQNRQLNRHYRQLNRHLYTLIPVANRDQSLTPPLFMKKSAIKTIPNIQQYYPITGNPSITYTLN